MPVTTWYGLSPNGIQPRNILHSAQNYCTVFFCSIKTTVAITPLSSLFVPSAPAQIQPKIEDGFRPMPHMEDLQV